MSSPKLMPVFAKSRYEIMGGMHIKGHPRLAFFLPARRTFPGEAAHSEGRPGGELSRHMRCQQITPMKGTHGSVWLLQSALIMGPCGSHVPIDPDCDCSETAERRKDGCEAVEGKRLKSQGSRLTLAKRGKRPHTCPVYTHIKCSLFV